MKLSQWFYLSAFLAATSVFHPAFADRMLCARVSISGLDLEDERGLALLGSGTTADPKTMSIYITIGKYHSKTALYVQSNFKSAQYSYPFKVAVNEDVDIRTVISWITGTQGSPGFDSRAVTFYVDPSFYRDPTYGKYQNQLTGIVVNLKGGDEDFAGKPGAYGNFLALGNSAYGRNDYEGALKPYGSAIGLDGTRIEAFVGRGKCLLAMKRLPEALTDFNQALVLKPGQPDVFFLRGIVSFDQKNFASAASDFSRLIESKPNFEPGYRYRGDAELSLSNFKASEADFAKAVLLDPGDVRCHFGLGYSRFMLGRIAESIPEYEQAIALDGSYFPAFLNRGRAYWKLNDTTRAMADFNKAVEVGPNEEDGYFNRGCLYRDLGEFESALSDFNKSVQNKPSDPDAFFQRGYVYERMGQFGKAVADYQHVLEMNPNYAKADASLKRAQSRAGNSQ